MLSRSHKLAYTGSEVDFTEAIVQPNLVDINDYCRNSANADTHSGLKPSLKPLKISKMKRKDDQRELDAEAMEASQKKIIYIKTFNHVKNEAIVQWPENSAAKSLSNYPSDYKTTKSSNKKKAGLNIDSQISLSFFKRNKEKFNPIVKPLKNKQSSEDNSTLKEFEFLTGVNIQEAENNEEQEQNEEKEDELFQAKLYEMRQAQTNPRESLPYGEEPMKETGMTRSTKEQTNLPAIKKSSLIDEKGVTSVSEARYQRYVNQKPKMYISYKTNAVQPFGKPSNYQEHLVRVYNKEATPIVPYPLVDHLGPRKDYQKAMLDTYLAQFNLEALKLIDEDLYEYAKQRTAL